MTRQEDFCQSAKKPTRKASAAAMVDASRPQHQLSHKKCKLFLRHSLRMFLHGYERVKGLGRSPIHGPYQSPKASSRVTVIPRF